MAYLIGGCARLISALSIMSYFMSTESHKSRVSHKSRMQIVLNKKLKQKKSVRTFLVRLVGTIQRYYLPPLSKLVILFCVHIKPGECDKLVTKNHR